MSSEVASAEEEAKRHQNLADEAATGSIPNHEGVGPFRDDTNIRILVHGIQR